MPRADLSADCASCFALCCVAPAFAASSDFAIDKPAGHACPNLLRDFRCGIHTELRGRGFKGCTVYDCFGAGQKVSQVTFGGEDWHARPEMFATFPIMRNLHELLYYLDAARGFAPDPELGRAFDEIERLTLGTPDELAAVDVDTLRGKVNALTSRASERARAGIKRRKDRRGADLIGKDLHGASLRGANLRGAYLIGANLAGADLYRADVIGADLRGADLSGADLSETLFLIQSQLDAAHGDHTTKLPAGLTHPAHW